MNPFERKARLEALLLRFQTLWRPQPFKLETPDWCKTHPVLTRELLALDDETVEQLSTDNQALIALLARHIPEIEELTGLTRFPPAPASRETRTEDRLHSDVPGRKRAQIEAYAAAVGEPVAPLLEWCAGKGHLGRLLTHRWRQPVTSLEIDAVLCDAGSALARRTAVADRQHFIRADVLTVDSARHLTGRHAVALHACGDLHTSLIAHGIEQRSPAIDVAPCCYYRTRHGTYQPFNDTPLVLNRDDLRLAVTETATASASQRRRSRRALAWKLGWLELRKTLTGETEYRPFPPVPETWLRGGFADFIRQMMQRTGLAAPTRLDMSHFEVLGHARAARMLRLQTVRLAFRRALEVWLLMDMATHLEHHHYKVSVTTFCPREITPRNLLLSARRT